MKRKLMICAMALCICAGLAGNTGAVSVWASEESSSDAVRIGVLKGPTAMGMAQLLDEDGYDFTIAASPDEIVPMVVQDKLDIAAVPANLAATLYQKTDKDVSVLAVNTLGVLYLVENGDSVKSVEDLKGKTIYASGKGATPEYALNSVLKANGIDPEKDVTVEFKSEHAEVVSALVQDQTAVGLLPIAASGADITKLMEGAASARKAALELSFEENDALKYAAVRNILHAKGKSVEVLANYEPSLHYVSEWWKQLYGESEGKDQKGIFPASVDLTTDLHSMGQFIQDGSRIMYETVLNVEKSREEVMIGERAGRSRWTELPGRTDGGLRQQECHERNCSCPHRWECAEF